MSARPRPSELRIRTARLAVAAVAGLSSVLAIAPAAFADDTPVPGPNPTDTTTPEAPAPVETTPAPVETPTPAPVETAPTPTPGDGTPTAASAPSVPADVHAKSKAADVSADAVAPDYGYQKFRVGVQVTDGSWVPEGTTTVGTKFTITVSGPSVAGDSYSYTCTTDASTVGESGTASYCVSDTEVPQFKAAAVGGVVVDPNDPTAPFSQLFYLDPGNTVKITQQTVMPNLRKATKTATIGPCIVDPATGNCPGSAQSTVLFNDPGFPPIAKDDHRRTGENQAINIRVLSNDDPVHGAPVTALNVVSDPGHGTAKVNGHLIRYTPNHGFVGKDTFDYTYATPNGIATATVTIVIVSADALLPDTGGSDARLLGLSLLLIAGGGWLIAEGRRRPSYESAN